MKKSQLKDHKQLGQELELYFTHEIAPGAPFWLPKGMIIFQELEKYIRNLTEKGGYQETSTPIMVKSQLFVQSGHWEKFGEHNMYNLTLSEEDDDGKSISYTLKPMNCPESTIIYGFRIRSYKELPLRFSEIGRLHRREKSGEINGLLRVRQLTMDDAHLYVTEDQIFPEVSRILDTMMEFYDSFGFKYDFRLATRPDQFAGTMENWHKAEKDLAEVLKLKNLPYSTKEKDGAFYGPKIDLHIKDAHNRDWQLATAQLDFSLPERFNLKYMDGEGKAKRPVMIHRAIFGSFERFVAMLTEHFQGAFPLWLSPIQVIVIPITDKNIEYGQKVLEQLKSSNIRAELDDRAETMQAKIRDATLQKIPYMIIVGDREEKEAQVSVRTREGKDLGEVSLSRLIDQLKEQIEKKS